MSSSSIIPTIDLSPFFFYDDEEEDENGRNKKVMKDLITEACSEYGFFQVVNHGVPQELLSRAMELSRTYFQYPEEKKLKCCPNNGAPLPAGYVKQPLSSPDNNEYLLMFPPHTGFNVLPLDPPDFKKSLEEMFGYFWKLGEVIERIVNECLGLPENFLKEFNNERNWDILLALRYFPATENQNNNIGLTEHEDGNIFTFVVQDNSAGLEVLVKNGEWIPVIPEQGKIVVNVGDVIQVLSNNKFKSATHRVVRPKGNSLVFFYNLDGDKWVEPLPQFTYEIGEKPKYRGFLYKDYQALRMRNKTHPPSNPQDVIHITHYAI